MYQTKMKAAKGCPSRAGHSKNPCISLRSSIFGCWIFKQAAETRTAAAAPAAPARRALQLTSRTESLSCL